MISVYIHEYEKAAQNNYGGSGAARDMFFRECLCDYLNVSGEMLDNMSSKMLDGSARLDVEYGESGKPRFVDKHLADVHFSVSHSGGFLALAFSDSKVGIDIEDLSRRHNDAERYRKLARRFFTVNEANYVSNGLSGDDVKRRFFLVWTAKEAYVKYTGEGIAENFKRFSVRDAIEREGTKTVSLDFADGVYLARVAETADMICVVCGVTQEYIINKW
jgi:phosphopantetheine--protein transferase-like protein